jgi:hypothetical protein
MNKKSKPIDKYITLEDALPKIYKYHLEDKETSDGIRDEILKTGEYDRGNLKFHNKDGAWLTSEANLKEWINKRKKEKNDERFEYMREKYPFFKSNLEFLMYKEGKYTISSLAEALYDNFKIAIGRSAVGNYLTRDTYCVPERDIMFAMAKEFGYTVEALGEIDIESLHEKATSAQNYSINEEDVEFFYPIICTEKDLENDNFLSGMCKYAQFKDSASTIQEFYSVPQESMECFWKSGEEGIYYGYTNWITLFFISYDGFGAMEEGNKNIDLSKSKKSFLKTNLPMLNKALLILKQNGKYAELVYYFLARQLISGLITTTPTVNKEQQMVGGWTMMIALASIKNPFAERFVNVNRPFWSFLLE